MHGPAVPGRKSPSNWHERWCIVLSGPCLEPLQALRHDQHVPGCLNEEREASRASPGTRKSTTVPTLDRGVERRVDQSSGRHCEVSRPPQDAELLLSALRAPMRLTSRTVRLLPGMAKLPSQVDAIVDNNALRIFSLDDNPAVRHTAHFSRLGSDLVDIPWAGHRSGGRRQAERVARGAFQHSRLGAWHARQQRQKDK